MNANYVIFYTLFGLKYCRGFKSSCRHFETLEEINKFIKYKQIEKGSYIIYKRIDSVGDE
jgi:hypothetical protein